MNIDEYLSWIDSLLSAPKRETGQGVTSVTLDAEAGQFLAGAIVFADWLDEQGDEGIAAALRELATSDEFPYSKVCGFLVGMRREIQVIQAMQQALR